VSCHLIVGFHNEYTVTSSRSYSLLHFAGFYFKILRYYFSFLTYKNYGTSLIFTKVPFKRAIFINYCKILCARSSVEQVDKCTI
jgi:hypothetical protein